MSISKHKKMKATELDEAFDTEDVLNQFDVKNAKVKYPTKRLTIDFTESMVHKIDEEAAKIGITRTSLIKMWVAERLHHNR